MKKLALTILLPIMIASSVPLCPRHWLPSNWVASYEYGMKWSRLLAGSYFDDSTAPRVGKETPIGKVAISVNYRPAATPCSQQVQLSAKVQHLLTPHDQQELVALTHEIQATAFPMIAIEVMREKLDAPLQEFQEDMKFVEKQRDVELLHRQHLNLKVQRDLRVQRVKFLQKKCDQEDKKT